MPADIAALPRPVLGFWGLIQDWLDVPLVAAVARARPGWSIVLIGEAATDVSTLAGLPSVHLLGRRAYEQLPAYAKGFDVGLIPFRVNELTRAVNPIKLREYLSAGLPVVSTPLPEVARYEELVSIAANAKEFVEACERVFAEVRVEGGASIRCRCGPGVGDGSSPAAEARQAVMRSETWRAKVAAIDAQVAGCLGQANCPK